MNSPNALGSDALQTKITKLEAEVGERQKEINEAHQNKDNDIASAEHKIKLAETRHEELKTEKARQLQEAADVAAKGRALIASGEKQLTESRRMVQEAEAMDLGLGAIKEAKQFLITVRNMWSNKLSQLQDGQTRRKFAELEKLRRRLAGKQGRKEEYGTQALRDEEAARKEKHSEEEEAAREYTLGMQGVRRMKAAAR